MLRRLLPLLLLGGSLAACAVNPATGERSFTAFMSESQEAEIGRESHPKVLAEFGGAYDDPELQRYVQELGARLAKTTERPNASFTFTVLDSPIVNAFAVPGGYVYVTRGLLALADDEAELASVLAHEIGHVVARHSAQRYSRSVLAQIGLLGLGVATGSGDLVNLAGTGAQVFLQGYSREQEFEADTLGIRYMARARFEPRAAAAFLAKLEANSRLEAELAGRPEAADQFDIMSTHPRTLDRVERAIANAGATVVSQPVRGHDAYLQKIDGILWGADPSEGIVRGRAFLHPALRFAFEVPEGFRLQNGPNQVLAEGPGGAVIAFDRAPRQTSGSMADYLTRQWAANVDLRGVETFEVDGMEAATGLARLRTRRGAADLRPVAIRFDAGTVYRFLFITPPELTARLSAALRETAESFRRLDAAEVKELAPLRVQVVTVRPGETVADLARRMPFAERREERFRVLNGLAEEEGLRAGQKVKIITG